MKVVTQHYIGTTDEWKEANPKLYEAVWGFEKTKDGKVLAKLGNGKDCWNDLKYFDFTWRAMAVIEAEAQTREEADQELAAAVEAEARARGEADQELGQAIAALTPEGIENIPVRLEEIEGKITDEAQARADAEQALLAEIESKLAQKAPLTDPVFTGTPKVQSKTSAAINDGTLIATEAQVALKAPNYPVGAIFMSVDPTSPAVTYGGTWTVWGTGRVPVAVDTAQTEFNTVEKTGGAKTHTLTLAQMPSHSHPISPNPHDHTILNPASAGTNGVTIGIFFGNGNTGSTSLTIDNAGSGNSHNNLQPYITCYMWKKTAA
jgi:hypothetical protein